ncbi:putative disease resistance RPP13-like protein 1 [Cinnamomum micranthum f. kanehirae]|uniref:Putative disease resistance RPP13-like protein 1 n=1 Tax=Cinnamomum micranthum f. kanehirae TaxID=337451 RepID=A0A3S3QWJ8_9MAGN|nr:putative disease resistance RPP13-like protein 1 [Cinnamomum micranthum f. kanehirae]
MVITKLISQEGDGEGSGIGAISVVGIGGIGKTTLAQLIYNDKRVKTHFTKRMWVCLSEDFSVADVTKKIMEEATGNACHLSELNTLQTRLIETLQDELFLLVLDDVWHGDETEWERLRLPLKCGRHGIAELLPGEREECIESEDIGRQIVEKCEGVPLSAKTIGSVMHRKRTTIPPKLFDHVKFLRALDLSGSPIRRVPSSIGKLKHLRYLNLSKTAVEELPESVGSLCNLQTLKLNQCTSLCTLPRGTSKLISLRHLEIEGTKKFKHTLEGIGRLSSLRTLSKFVVQDEGGCNIGELGNLNLLNGSLEIKNLERVASEDKARKAELKKKQHLQTLILHCDEKTEDDWRMIDNDEGRMEGVFKGLGLAHTRVKQLIISNYMGSMFPSWTEGSSFFTRLVDVDLFDCRKLKQMPTLGMFPSLKYLNIEGNDEVERLGCEFIGNGVEAFPKLEKLTLSSFSKLEEWKLQLEDGHTALPRLLQLTIEHCPKLKLLPPLGKLPCLKFLEIIVNQAMEKVGMELYGSGNSSCSVKGVAFPKLEKLLFYSLSNWEVWDFRVNDGDNIMPCLLELSIERCPKLKSVPGHLTIAYCDEVIWRPLPCHPTPCLEELVLKGQIGELPPLPNLKVLKIIDTANLSSVHENVWEQLELLHTLCIWDCHQLTTLPAGLGKIVSLQTLHINQCTQLNSLPDNLGQLKSLQTLYIIYCPQLKSLTDGLKELKSLCALHIIRCEELQSIPHWLGELESLHTLHIRYCSQLTSLPDGLAQLKSRHHSAHIECMQNLPSYIRCCMMVWSEHWRHILCRIMPYGRLV